jgi:hypothetical protein
VNSTMKHNLIRVKNPLTYKSSYHNLPNLLKPIDYVMHQQVEYPATVRSAHTAFMCFCIYLRTTSDFCHLHHKLIGFCNRDEKCLLRGTNWVFK